MKLGPAPVAATALLTCWLMATVTVAPAASATAGYHVAGAAGGTQLWVATHAVSTANSRGYAAAVSPDGSRVFVTGAGGLSASSSGYDTVAYDAATGVRLWVARLTRPGGPTITVGTAPSKYIAVSPDGSMVFVIANFSSPSLSGHATVAYRAATGARLWMTTDTSGGAGAAAASPDGSTVFVTGNGAHGDCQTVAYHTATGVRVWARSFRGPHRSGNIDCIPTDLKVSPDGSTVFITGYDFDTVAYDAATGTTVWVAHYGPGAKAACYYNNGTSAAVTPDGSKVLVTGGFFMPCGGPGGSVYATVAFSAATGAKLWVRRYSEPAGALNVSTAIAVSPDGSTVFVTGWSRVTSSEWADATVAYLTATGRRLWVQRYDEPAGEPYPAAIAVSPDGSKVFVTGGNYATVAYRAATGGLFWTARYSGGTNANAVVASPDGSKVFVTGYGNVGGGQDTYTTVAYSS